jgi:hypothetical protein
MTNAQSFMTASPCNPDAVQRANQFRNVAARPTSAADPARRFGTAAVYARRT